MEGALFDRVSQFDVSFITLKKAERLFSAIGLRDIHHAVRGGMMLPFLCLVFADYVSHEAERIWFFPEWRFAGGCTGRSHDSASCVRGVGIQA